MLSPYDQWKLSNGPYENLGIPAELFEDAETNYAAAHSYELHFKRRLGLHDDAAHEKEEADERS